MASDTDLAAFLRASRARLSPADVGLPDGGRRRKVPGLRREEVAQLANVSVDYVTRLEQGRSVSVSREILEALADALVLRPDEREYLMTVADARRRPAEPPPMRVAPQLRTLVDGLRDTPAFVYGRRHQILACNRTAAALFPGFDTGPAAERNMIRLTFLHPAYRELYVDWALIARGCVDLLRMHARQYPDDPELIALVGELSIRDADFRAWWGSHRVRADSLRRKSLRHPLVGELTIEAQQLTVEDHPEQHLVAYTAAADRQSQEAMAFLIQWANSEGPGRLVPGGPARSRETQ
jgi:transcriptional regulator with XRE-family HTH domain